MKVKFLASVLIQGEHVEQGEVVDLDDDLAKEMFKIGRAEKYKPTSDKTASAADGITAKSLFNELNLPFQQGKALLKSDFDFTVQNNDTVIPTDIADQVRKLSNA